MNFEHLDEQAIAYAKKTIQCKSRQLVRQTGLSDSELNDLKQEMWADLLRRFSWFESDRSKAKTFIARVVSHRVAAILRHRSEKVRSYLCDEGSLSEPTEDADGRIVERAQMIPENAHNLRTGAETRSTLEQVELTSDIETVLVLHVSLDFG
jgi:DNA-directed RNA polymerase specialized sigma24 family protein